MQSHPTQIQKACTDVRQANRPLAINGTLLNSVGCSWRLTGIKQSLLRQLRLEMLRLSVRALHHDIRHSAATQSHQSTVA